MSSRYLVYLLFGLWSLICWRWYVCGVKEICTTTAKATIAETPVPEPIAPVVEESPSTPPASSTDTKPVENSNIETVQVIESGDNAEIHFPYNSTQNEKAEEIDGYLSKIASQLSNSNQKVTIIGHTDGIGDAKTNFAFAERRAKNIRDILKAKGVKHEQIVCVSKGESMPIATNDTPEGRYKNRRVEIKISNN
jgi:outer membrane protein OmpA-like peptidoglycan-associated protein